MTCHEGRVIASPIVRELMRAVGAVTCPDCHRLVAVLGRRNRYIREK